MSNSDRSLTDEELDAILEDTEAAIDFGEEEVIRTNMAYLRSEYRWLRSQIEADA